MNKFIYLIFLQVLFISSSVQADWKDTMNQSWEKAKDSTIGYYKSYFPGQKTSLCTENQSSVSLNDKWDSLLIQLEQATDKFQQIRNAPSSSWFGEDKESLAVEFNAMLDKTIILLLEDTPAINCWNKFQQLQTVKRDMQLQKMHTRESLIAATGEKQKQLQKTLDETIEKIDQLDRQQHDIEQEMRISLRQLGLKLDSGQMAMLLARVDAKDIVQMTIVFDAVKAITLQLEELMRINSDNLTASKKYYGMYVVLSEMIVYIQNNYLTLIIKDYIPGIEAIISKVKEVQKQTLRLKDKSDVNRQTVYNNNLIAQNLTIDTANLYLQHLHQQQQKINESGKIAYKDLQMAKNTYETVQLSVELLKLLKSSRTRFQHISQLQLPEIVPLDNIAMQKEYQRLTLELSK